MTAIRPHPFGARLEVATGAGGTLGCDMTSVDYLTLTGLSLTWGRSSVQDQPSTGTCSFELAAPDDDRWQQDFSPGVPVTVYASVQIGVPGVQVDYVTDGGFETTPLNQRASGNWFTQVGFGPGRSGARSIRVTPIGDQNIGRVNIPPAPFSDDPNAWATIPQPTPDSAWTLRAWVRTPLAWGAVSMQLARFVTPDTTNPPVGVGQVVPIADGWQQVEITVTTWAGWVGGWPGFVFLMQRPVPWTDWTGAWADQTATWDQLGALLIDDVQIFGPQQSIVEQQVFSGRVTDVTASWDGTPTTKPVRVTLTATDWSADLENQLVGAAGYPQQGAITRANTIVAELVTPVPVTTDDWTPAVGRLLTRRDPGDPAGAMTLLAEAATSIDAVLWPTWQPITGFWLWLENPSARSALQLLTLNPGTGLVSIVGTGRPSDGILLSACDINRDPVQFHADVSDVVTRVEVGWNAPVTVDGQPGYEDRTATVIDQAAEADWGQRGVQVSTQLIDAGIAETVATRILNRSRAQGWTADGLAWDTDRANTVDQRRAALTLLNGATRPGLPIVFDQMPDWAPDNATGCYLEGGTYTYTSGRWEMNFTVSPSGTAGLGVRWNQLTTPAWTWAQFDPAVLWWHLATATIQSAIDQHDADVAAHAATYLTKEE